MSLDSAKGPDQHVGRAPRRGKRLPCCWSCTKRRDESRRGGEKSPRHRRRATKEQGSSPARVETRPPKSEPKRPDESRRGGEKWPRHQGAGHTTGA